MARRHIRSMVRRTLSVTFGLLIVGLIALVGVSHVAPMLGHEVFIVRGASMSPAIPLGSLVAARFVDATPATAGDVITIRLPSDVVVTHRIVEVVDQPDGTYFQTRGDANPHADPVLVPSAAVIGVVDLYAPAAGYLLAFLSMPSGIISILSILGALMLAVWRLEDIEAEERVAAGVRSPAPRPA